MCKCGHTPEQHEVSGMDGFHRSLIGTLYTSYCKEPECSCEIYRLVEAIPVAIEGTRKRR